jgi:hypothetical protein
MYIVGVDYHPSFQQIAFLDQAIGECGDWRLNSSDREAEKLQKGRPLVLRLLTGRVDFLPKALLR